MSESTFGISEKEIDAFIVAKVAQRQADAIARWITPGELAVMPDGPYAVYVYYPATQREIRTRNHSPLSAAQMADREAARGFRVHVSPDTCG